MKQVANFIERVVHYLSPWIGLVYVAFAVTIMVVTYVLYQAVS